MFVVGRERELGALLRQVREAMTSGSGRTLFIEGAAGVGKTALVSELIARLSSADPGIALARGRCQQVFGSGDPYLPFVEALRDLADEDATGSVSRETVAELLTELAPYWLAVIPLVGSFLSAGLQTAIRLRGKPRTAPSQGALFLQYLRVIEQLARRGPLVLFIDDLHRADTGSVALLSHLCRGIAHLPVVVIGALQPAGSADRTRPIRDTILELEREHLAARMTLEELEGDGLQDLLTAELGGELSAPLRDRIVETAGGNPLFAGELCRLFRRDGVAVREGDIWHLAEGVGAVEIPRSAELAIGQRVERLDAESIRVLQYASIQGNEFSSIVLARVLEEDELVLLDRLDEIERSEALVSAAGEVPLPGGEVATVFRFASPLLHTVLYRQVVGKRRVLLHRKTAEVLQTLFQDSLSLVAGELAWHFRQGRVPENAERYLHLVEQNARKVHARWSPPLESAEAAGGSQGRAGLQAPFSGVAAAGGSTFVGREEELDLLAREVALAVELRSGRTIFVQGPPGAGKTTLVGQLLARVTRDRPQLTIARGRCLPTLGSGDPYLPFVEALRDISDEKTLGLTDKESFGALLADIAPIWIATVPVVGNLLAATLSTATTLRGKQKESLNGSREALFIEYVELLRRLSERSPLLLFFDDLHWADQSSVALLAHISRAIERLPIVVIATLRDDQATREHPALAKVMMELEREDLARRIELEELSGEVLNALLAAEFGGDVSEPLRRWVTDTAGGNPLFASELCRLLRQSGAAVDVRGEWLLTDRVHELGVPRSAEAVIEKRVQQLDALSLRALQYASVEGNEFDSVVLCRLLEEEELRVLERLERLERRDQLVRLMGEVKLPGGDTATAVQFRHALVQTVLYRQLAGKRRILLHRRAGEILESLFREQEEGIAGKLARHFHHGRVDGRAYRYARMAADGARRVFAHWEAEELYRIALEHSPDATAVVQLEERLGDVYDTVGYYPNGLASYRRALQKCAEDATTALRLRRKEVSIERKAGLIPAPALLERVQALLARAEGNPTERCHLLLERGRLPGTKSLAGTSEALRAAEELADPALLSNALEQHADALIFAGRPRDALPHLARARSISDGNPLQAARNYNRSGIVHAMLGEYASARAHFEEMLAVVERTGDFKGIGAACDCLGRLLLRLGDYAEAERLLQRARVAHDRRDRSTIGHSLYNLADRALVAGELELARQRFHQLLQESTALGQWNFQALAYAGLGLCLLGSDRGKGALPCVDGIRSTLAGRDHWFEGREVVEIFLARMEALAGDVASAERRLTRAAETLEQGDVYLWTRLQLELIRILVRTRTGQAVERMEQVARTAEGIQSPPLHAEVETVRALVEAARPLKRPVVQ